MSTSRSSSRNETSTQDQRTTNTINAGIGGDIDESLVNSGNYGDTSLANYVDESTYESSYDYDTSYSDDSDNSFNLDLVDESDNSVDNSISNVTDGGAFDLVDNLGYKLIETLGESQRETLGAVNELLGRQMDASTNLARQSLDGAMSIKAGQTITEPANQTTREMVNAGVKIAAVAGAAYAASKVVAAIREANK